MKGFDVLQAFIAGVFGLAALVVLATHTDFINKAFSGAADFTKSTLQAAR